MTSARFEKVRTVDTLGEYTFRDRRFLWSGERGVPLVLELHGSGLDGLAQLRTSGLYRTASRRGFAVAAPDAAIPLRLSPDVPAGFAWNVPGVPLVDGSPSDHGPDDVAFLGELVTAIAPSKLYVAGFSGGARLASLLAFELDVWGLATVAGLRLPAVTTRPPPATIAFHGDRDLINPIGGGAGPRWAEGVEATLAAFATRFGWGRGDQRVSPHVHRTVMGAPHDARFVQYVIEGGLHVWPGTHDPEHLRAFGPTTDELDASEVIWDYFTKQ